MKQSHNTHILCGSLPGRKLHPRELCFILYLERVTQFHCNLLCSLRSSGKLHTHSWEPFSLRSLLFLYCFLLTIYSFSLSLSQSLQIVTFMLKELTTGYSKITIDLITEPELDNSYNLINQLAIYLSHSFWLASQLSNCLTI